MKLALLAALLFALPAAAQDTAPPPQLGGCFKAGKLCLGPSAAVTVAAINFSRSSIEPSFSPGVGYGLTVNRGAWDSFGADVFLALDTPRQTASVTLMFKFASNYIRLGISKGMIGEHDWRMPVGVGLDF